MEAYLDNSATTMAYPEVGELVYKSDVPGLRQSVIHAPQGCGCRALCQRSKRIFGKAYERNCKRDLFYFRWNGER